MIDDLRKALDHTAALVAAVPDDLYDAPTPCPDFDVRTLMNHLVAGNVMFAGTASGEPLDMSVFGQDHLGNDAGAAYRRSAELALAAWQSPGVLEESLSFANLPGSTVIKLHLTEELTHGWDLAKATGQDATIDPRLAQIALDAMRQMPDQMVRVPTGFGPEVEIDSGAPAHDRLVAFLGRDPA